MNTRERFRRAIRHQEPDRVPMCELEYWPETIARWEAEGLPHGISPIDYFGLDQLVVYSFDSSLRIPSRTIEETDEWVIAVDSNGVVRKRWKQRYGAPGSAEPTIRTQQDWEHVRGNLVPDADRLSRDVRNRLHHDRPDAYCTISAREPARFAMTVLGYEQGLMLFGEDPGFSEDIFAACVDFNIGMVQIALDVGLHVDGVFAFSSLCYSGGMVFSPRYYRDHLAAYHRRYADFCRERDLDLILHADGDVRQLIPLLIESGFDCIQPLEARQGNDVRVLKPLYGDRMSFFGNIGVDAMARGSAAIEEEVSTKIPVAKERGGYIFHSDHSIPPTVGFEDYRFLIEQARLYGAYACR